MIFKSQRGFTLLEIMVVMAIIVGVITMVAPKISNKNSQMKAAVRRFSVLTRQVRSNAKLQGASYRIAFNLKSRPEDVQSYWIERSNNSVLLPKDKKSAIEEAAEASKEKEKSEDKSPSSAGFTQDSGLLKGKQTLPGGLRFKEIELVGLEQPIDSGMAYIHFHPQGLVEEAAIHLKYGTERDGGLEWTIAIHPLTGKADIITENVSLKEIREQ